ncbi:Quinate/shikimate dehydrogenase [Aquimixticola soesokkakensis]|uniref:Quinate/shikimate dehydrogenase n=1 Tax=Aquimixticola soesokkakensis TaxID=1519096 RepID=A0A1Y5TKA2_9RHOB|nr:shikimate dehydrogenase [Aquimixticola soesokkakensis]SLN66291.1 Quinate/shikimate dehydrogenase [Aquimixticola soesokkakensis]
MTFQRTHGTSGGQLDCFRIGLLGHGIAASRTPKMHSEEGRAQGLDYSYELIDTANDPTPVSELLDQIEAAGFSGINVTYPYKRQVMASLDVISDAAKAVGAVNTVLFRDGKRFGHNTDYSGFAESFKRGLPDAARETVLLLGAGGAGGAVANALLDEGVQHLRVFDVSPDTAQALVSDLTARLGAERASQALDPEAAAAEAQGIVNASPVGMAKLPGLPLPRAAVRPDHWIADVVYFPLETEFLALGRSLGCATLPGSGMALFQAVRAFELFSGRAADPARMQAVFDSF